MNRVRGGEFESRFQLQIISIAIIRILVRIIEFGIF